MIGTLLRDIPDAELGILPVGTRFESAEPIATFTDESVPLYAEKTDQWPDSVTGAWSVTRLAVMAGGIPELRRQYGDVLRIVRVGADKRVTT